MPATIEIKNEIRGNIFGTLNQLKLLAMFIKTIFIKDFSNPTDQVRLKQVAKYEEVMFNFPNTSQDFLNQNKSSITRNPFNAIKKQSIHPKKHSPKAGQSSSENPEKEKEGSKKENASEKKLSNVNAPKLNAFEEIEKPDLVVRKEVERSKVMRRESNVGRLSFGPSSNPTPVFNSNIIKNDKSSKSPAIPQMKDQVMVGSTIERASTNHDFQFAIIESDEPFEAAPEIPLQLSQSKLPDNYTLRSLLCQR